MGVVWAIRRAHSTAIAIDRLATTDLVHEIASECLARGLRVGLYGSVESSVVGAAATLRSTHPGLEIVLVQHGYEKLDYHELRDCGVDVLLVGLGAGRQEAWALSAAEKCQVDRDLAPISFFTCGGLFDHISNARRRAPGWIQQVGLEWLYRTVQEPLRLGPRYISGNS